MSIDRIPFRKTNYFSSLICDYIEGSSELRPFYNRMPILESFQNQINEKKEKFSDENRKVLIDALKMQYQGCNTSKKTEKHIELLAKNTTFTITTGHQLNLFTGPLYFLYKIISAINLCSKLSKKYPDYNFVPVYWMATEDHDFDEINYFNFFGKKVQWNRKDGGAVGVFDTNGLDGSLS